MLKYRIRNGELLSPRSLSPLGIAGGSPWHFKMTPLCEAEWFGDVAMYDTAAATVQNRLSRFEHDQQWLALFEEQHVPNTDRRDRQML